MQMISDDGHHASARAVCVVRFVPTVDSRTERLCVLPTVTVLLIRTVIIPYPAVIDVFRFSKEINAALEL